MSDLIFPPPGPVAEQAARPRKVDFVAYGADGEIVRHGQCSRADFDAMAQWQGEMLMLGHGSPLSHCVIGGELVAYTPEQAQRKLQRAQFPARWDNDVMDWVATDAMPMRKRRKLAELRAAAQAAGLADIMLAGKTFAAGSDEQTELMREALMAQLASADGQPYSLDWETADGAEVTLTAAQVKALVRAIRQRAMQIRQQLRALRATIEVAADAAAIDAIVWIGE